MGGPRAAPRDVGGPCRRWGCTPCPCAPTPRTPTLGLHCSIRNRTAALRARGASGGTGGAGHPHYEPGTPTRPCAPHTLSTPCCAQCPECCPPRAPPAPWVRCGMGTPQGWPLCAPRATHGTAALRDTASKPQQVGGGTGLCAGTPPAPWSTLTQRSSPARAAAARGHGAAQGRLQRKVPMQCQRGCSTRSRRSVGYLQHEVVVQRKDGCSVRLLCNVRTAAA